MPEEFLDLPFVADAWGSSGIYFMPRRASGELVFGSVDHRFESEIVPGVLCSRSLHRLFATVAATLLQDRVLNANTTRALRDLLLQ